MTTTHDFQDGTGPVQAHQHPNGGGWVADTAYVAPTAYVDGDAEVFGNARVYGSASIYGISEVSGNARVCVQAVVEHSFVFGDARVYDYAQVCGHTEIYGEARVYDSAEIFGSTCVSGMARVFDHVSVYNLWVSDDDTLFGKAMVFGDNFVSGYDRRTLPGDTKGPAEEVTPPWLSYTTQSSTQNNPSPTRTL